LGHHGPDAGFGVEGWNPGSAGADALGKRPLRIELQLAGEVEALEQLVFADIGADLLAIWPLLSRTQRPKPPAPALFERTVSRFTPASHMAGIRLSGLPESPNPPDMIVIPSNSNPSKAAAGLS